MKKADSALPAPITVPMRQEEKAAGSAAQQAFEQAVLDVENLREQLRDLRAQQAEARQRYWQQVGPAATAVVAARHALYAPLEEALLLSYFSRLEEEQITGIILGNARNLEERFGEDETAIIRKYAPAGPRPTAQPAARTASNSASEPDGSYVPDPTLPPHEQAAAARARRKTKAQRQHEAAAQADQQQLTTNAKTLYRQLARTHHPDLERDPARQADKTAQMQRITEAYEADDLYTLLRLLAESGPADAAADDVLARYTRALLQQQTTLKQAMNELKYGPNGFVTTGLGRKQELELRQLKRDLRAEAEYVQHVGRLMSEVDGLRDMLRQLAAEGLDSV